MSDKICDHTTAGMLVWKDDKLLLIERMKFPFGFAPPAGHVDGDSSFEVAARRELKEEVGLEALNLELIWEGRKENPCRRQGGAWHYWKVYRVEVEGELNRSLEETKGAAWYSRAEIEQLLKRTEAYKSGTVSEDDWREVPGIEVVWSEVFKDVL